MVLGFDINFGQTPNNTHVCTIACGAFLFDRSEPQCGRVKTEANQMCHIWLDVVLRLGTFSVGHLKMAFSQMVRIEDITLIL